MMDSINKAKSLAERSSQRALLEKANSLLNDSDTLFDKAKRAAAPVFETLTTKEQQRSLFGAAKQLADNVQFDHNAVRDSLKSTVASLSKAAESRDNSNGSTAPATTTKTTTLETPTTSTTPTPISTTTTPTTTTPTPISTTTMPNS